MAPDNAQRKAALDDTIYKMCNANGSGLKENGFTLGWDVVVSYSEKQINDLLAKKWAKVDSGIIKEIQVPKLTWSKKYKINEKTLETLNLGAPKIRFAGGAVSEPAVELLMPIKGGYTQDIDSNDKVSPKKYGDLSQDAFMVRLTGIRLGTVTGKYDVVKNSLDPPVKSSKETCIFKSDHSKPTTKDYQVAWVVLNIPMEGEALNISVDITVPESNKQAREEADGMVNDILGSVTEYFKNPRTKIKALDYALATIKNKPQYDGAMTVDLTPVKFHLATFAASYHQDRSLSLFIQTTSGKDSGVKADLQVKWMAQWTNENAAPIPAGYSSSLLFNSDLVYNAMIKPGLEKSKDWNLDSQRDTAKSGGVAFVAKKQTAWWAEGFIHKYEATFNNCQVEVDSFSVDLKDSPLNIHIYQKATNSPPIAHLNWSFSKENEWVDMTQDPKWWNLGHRAGFGSANIRTTYKFDDDLPLKITVTDNDFSFDIDTDNMKQKWKFSQEAVDRTGNWFERLSKWIANAITAGPPDDVDNKRKEWMASLRPEIDFDIVGLGFFLTTNLLMPGSRVIRLDKSAGFRFPRDVVLVGDVVEDYTLAKN